MVKDNKFYSRLSRFFKAVRLPNLVMIALAVFLIHYYLIGPSFSMLNLSLDLPLSIIVLLSFVTVSSAVYGNLVNDLYDQEIDQINHPERPILHGFSELTYKTMSYVFLMLSFLSSIWLATAVCSFITFVIVLVVLIGLRYYASHLKRMVFWGNLLVAAFSALSMLLVWVVNVSYFQNIVSSNIINNEYFYAMSGMVFVYVSFSFFVTLMRELVKDMEDIEGDRLCEVKTIPIVLGVRFSKAYLVVSFVSLMCSFAFIYYSSYAEMYKWNYRVLLLLSILFAFCLTLFLVKDVKRLRNKRFSFVLKVYMLFGILSIFLASVA